MTNKSDYQKEYNKLVFGDKKKIELTPETVEQFLEKCNTIGVELNKKIRSDQDRAFDSRKMEPKDLEIVAKRLINEIGAFCNQADYIQLIKDLYVKGDKRYSPRYATQGEVDKYKIELARLFESLIYKLRLASFFGFGEIESSVGFVNTDKLPSLEEAKKMEHGRLKKYFDEAVNTNGMIENNNAETFKEDEK